ncbi:hypothetical protein GRJ2_001795400 [Grus japonensis]|uniref:Uncharacterized protein n=1 Tax=Grus japonensis TaxID=30415 RepID=A0ABC9X6J6_GRUJA
MGGSTKRTTPWKGEKRPCQCFQTAKGRSNSAFAISFGQTASSCKHGQAFRKLNTGRQLQSQHLRIPASPDPSISGSQHLLIPASPDPSISGSQHLLIPASPDPNIS